VDDKSTSSLGRNSQRSVTILETAFKYRLEVRLNEPYDESRPGTPMRTRRSWWTSFVAVAALTILSIAAEIGQILWFDSQSSWVSITLPLTTILIAAGVIWLLAAPRKFRQRAGIAAIAQLTGATVWATRLNSQEVEQLTIAGDGERSARHEHDGNFYFAVIDHQLVFWSVDRLASQIAFRLATRDVENVWRDNMRPTYVYLALTRPQPRVVVALRSTKGYWRRLVRDREDSFIAVDRWSRGVSN